MNPLVSDDSQVSSDDEADPLWMLYVVSVQTGVTTRGDSIGAVEVSV